METPDTQMKLLYIARKERTEGHLGVMPTWWQKSGTGELTDKKRWTWYGGKDKSFKKALQDPQDQDGMKCLS